MATRTAKRVSRAPPRSVARSLALLPPAGRSPAQQAGERTAHAPFRLLGPEQVVAQRSRRPAPVADGVLLLGRELGHRAAVRIVVAHERRVIAEAPAAARLARQNPLAASMHELLPP